MPLCTDSDSVACGMLRLVGFLQMDIAGNTLSSRVFVFFRVFLLSLST